MSAGLENSVPLFFRDIISLMLRPNSLLEAYQALVGILLHSLARRGPTSLLPRRRSGVQKQLRWGFRETCQGPTALKRVRCCLK